MSNRNTKGQFVKGHSIVGNRLGTVGAWAGKKRPDMAIRHSGNGNPQWKTEGLGYSGIHTWLRKTFPDAIRCEHCQSEKRLEWALCTGANYERERKNFLRLCKSCHMKYDYANGTRKPRGSSA